MNHGSRRTDWLLFCYSWEVKEKKLEFKKKNFLSLKVDDVEIKNLKNSSNERLCFQDVQQQKYGERLLSAASVFSQS